MMAIPGKEMGETSETTLVTWMILEVFLTRAMTEDGRTTQMPRAQKMVEISVVMETPGMATLVIGEAIRVFGEVLK
jgi:hypothetical protein